MLFDAIKPFVGGFIVELISSSLMLPGACRMHMAYKNVTEKYMKLTLREREDRSYRDQVEHVGGKSAKKSQIQAPRWRLERTGTVQ